ncbi:MAG: PAS domain S-box protein [Deltaproteobacteria bacterium]|nr:PAS domain S-box protein [Deltaproteobacteria bacterium]
MTEAHRTMAQDEERFRLIFEESPNPIWEEDFSKIKRYIDALQVKGVRDIKEYFRIHPVEIYHCVQLVKCVDANNAAVRLYGAKDKAGLLKKFGETFSEESFGVFADCLTALAEGKASFQAETVNNTLDGRQINVITRWSVVPGRENDLSMVLFSPIDITARARTERDVWGTNADLEQLFNSTVDGLCVIDLNYQLLRTNSRFSILLGASQEDLVGSKCYNVLCFSVCQTEQCIVNRILAGEDKVEIDIVRGQDELKKSFIYSAAPVRDSNGDIKSIICAIKDISERKGLEKQLSRAKKLKAIGQVAAGVAHEINTPMSYIGNNTRFLKDAFKGLSDVLVKYEEMKRVAERAFVSWNLMEELDRVIEEADLEYLMEEIPGAIDQSLEGITRVSKMVQTMKDLAYPGDETRTRMDIKSAIEAILAVTYNEWRCVAEIDADFDPNLPMIRCFPGEINQALLNIIVNAAHAVGEKEYCNEVKGKISIRTSQIDNQAKIRISDNGNGIPEEIRKRVFDPLFTMKEIDNEVGQGLAVAHSTVVDNHNGTIEIESKEGEGTTVVVNLPLDADIRDEKETGVSKTKRG